MVWVSFCGALKSDLVMVLGKAKLDSATCGNNHGAPSCSFWQQCCGEYGWVRVVKDGSSGHKGYAVRYRDLNGLDSLQWPVQSPDLNLIEALWVDMETELGEAWGRVGDIEALEACLKAAWESIPPERLDSLTRSMPARLLLMLREEQHHVIYLFLVYVDRKQCMQTETGCVPHTICHEKSLNLPDLF